MHPDPDALTEREARLLRAVGDPIVFTLLGSPLSYSAAIAFARCEGLLDELGGVVVYDVSPSTFIDESTALAICEMIDLSRRNGRYVILSGLQRHVVGNLGRAGVFDRLSEAQCFQARRAAIEAAIAYCRAN